MNVKEILQEVKTLPQKDLRNLLSQIQLLIEQNSIAQGQTQEDNEFDPRLKDSIIYEGDIVSSIDEIWDAEQ